MNNKGFTLIELLVVVAIIAGLAGIGIPKYLEMKSEARRGECLQLIPTIGKSARLFSAQVNGAPCRIHGKNVLKVNACTTSGGMMRFPIQGLTANGGQSKFFYSYNVGRGGINSTGFNRAWFPLATANNKLGHPNRNATTKSTGSNDFGNEDYVVTCVGIIAKGNTTGAADELKLLSSGEIRLYGDNITQEVVANGRAFQ